jgi:hypothetical protein
MRGLSSIGRASALQAEGQGFDSPSLHALSRCARLVGMVVRLGTSMLYCNTHTLCWPGLVASYGDIVQRLERYTDNVEVDGSNPSIPTQEKWKRVRAADGPSLEN